MIKITALPGLLCLAACGQQNSGLEQNVGSQSATPSQKASQQEASLKQQEASQKQQKASLKQKETEAEKALQEILERNLPNLSHQERQEVYKNEARTDRPTKRGLQINKEFALFVVRNIPPSRYGSEYDRLEREERVNSINKIKETQVDIQKYKVFENEAEREAYIESQSRQREIRYQKSVGRALTEQEKEYMRSSAEDDARESEEKIKIYREEEAQRLAPRTLPYTDAAGRAAYVKQKQEQFLAHYQSLNRGGGPVSEEQKKHIFREAEVTVQIEELRAKK